MPQPKTQPTTGTAAKTVAAGSAAAGLPGIYSSVALAKADVQVAKESVENATQLLLAAFQRFFRRARSKTSRRLFETLRTAHPEEPEDELRKLVREELDREAIFQQKMLARLRRDLPVALRVADPDERNRRVQAILAREQRYIAAREQAMVERAMGIIENHAIKRMSPQGAYWTLSADVKKHTLDCIALAGQFWPWEVLDEIHPPLHHGCACHLVTLTDAVALGWMTPDQIPDTTEAIGRATSLYEKAKALEQAIDVEEIGDYLRQLSEERYDVRYPKGSEHGGEFMPRTGAALARRAVHRALHDLLPHLPAHPAQRRRDQVGSWRWLNGRRVFVPEHRHFRRTIGGRTYSSPPGTTEVYHNDIHVDAPERGAPQEIVTPQGKLDPGVLKEVRKYVEGLSVREYDPVPTRPGPHRLLNRPWKSWGEFQDETQAIAARLGRQFDAPVQRGKVLTDKDGFDHSGLTDWHGNITFGPDVEATVTRDADALYGQHRVQGPDEIAATYNTFRVQAHEAAHTVNPADEQTYATPVGTLLEEALTEEVGHAILEADMHRQGRQDVIAWAQQHPDSDVVEGTYRGYRYALNSTMALLDVPPGERVPLLFHLKFGVAPDQRVEELAKIGNSYHPRTPWTTEKIEKLLVNFSHADGDHARYESLIKGDPGAIESTSHTALQAAVLARANDLADRVGGISSLKTIEWGGKGDRFNGDFDPRSGRMRVGKKVLSALQGALRAKADGRPLSERDARDAYVAAETLQHEMGHSINPTSHEQFQRDPVARSLEEALTEEMAHPLVAETLRNWGLTDPLAWARDHPEDDATRGTYQSLRLALQTALAKTDVPREEWPSAIEELKFHVKPEDRQKWFADHGAPPEAIRALGDADEVRRNWLDSVSFTPVLAPDFSGVPASPRRQAEGANTTIELQQPISYEGETGKVIQFSPDGKQAFIKIGDGAKLVNTAALSPAPVPARKDTGAMLHVGDRVYNPTLEKAGVIADIKHNEEFGHRVNLNYDDGTTGENRIAAALVPESWQEDHGAKADEFSYERLMKAVADHDFPPSGYRGPSSFSRSKTYSAPGYGRSALTYVGHTRANSQQGAGLVRMSNGGTYLPEELVEEPSIQEADWRPELHPRNPAGRFIDRLGDEDFDDGDPEGVPHRLLKPPVISDEIREKVVDSTSAEKYIHDKWNIDARLQPKGKVKPTKAFLQQITQALSDTTAKFPVLTTGTSEHGRLMGVYLASNLPPDAKALDPAEGNLSKGLWATTGPNPLTTGMAMAAQKKGRLEFTNPKGGAYILLNDSGTDPLTEVDSDPVLSGGLTPADSHPYGELTHELGHAVAQVSGFTYPGSIDDYGLPEAQALDGADLSPRDLAQVSYYGASDEHEAWAEVFATLNVPGALDEIRRVTPEIADKLEKLRTKSGTFKGTRIL